MRILGIPLWPEKLSDEQYVERTRKALRTLRRWRFFIALMFLGIIIAFIFLIFEGVHSFADFAGVGQTTKQHSTASEEQKIAYACYYFAVVLGGFVGLMFGNTVSHIGTILFAYRKDKLLVEFWDALSDAEKARLRHSSS